MMKIGPAVAAAAVFAIASPVCAQDAVQWRVEDGGNGHWYQVGVIPAGTTWHHARDLAAARGGHLATITSSGEAITVRSVVGTSGPWFVASPAWGSIAGPWLGAYQDEVGGGWHWITGEPWSFTAWCTNQPSGNACAEPGRFLHVKFGDYCDETRWWGDISGTAICLPELSGLTGMLLEFDADCNSDGIVDYGQIRDGTFPDVNANGVPDCCEPGESCLPCPGDVTKGGTVDAADLSILLAAWGTNGQGEFDTDLNGDGLVDGGDLALVLGGWGACP